MKRVSRRKSYPGPVRGTPIGDEIIGPCRGEGCEATVHRGDAFIVLLGDIVLCGKCHETGAKVKTGG